MSEPVIAKRKSYKVELEKGEYLWCSCGKSQNQPFCDDSHLGTDFEPVSFSITEPMLYSICGCKHTLTPPFCDNTHRTLPEEILPNP